MTKPPNLTDEQRRAARDGAVAARRRRAELKDAVRCGSLRCRDVIELARADGEQGRAAARMTIGELLLAVPGVGPVTADRHLVELGINGDRRLRALGDRQREAILAVLP